LARKASSRVLSIGACRVITSVACRARLAVSIVSSVTLADNCIRGRPSSARASLRCIHRAHLALIASYAIAVVASKALTSPVRSRVASPCLGGTGAARSTRRARDSTSKVPSLAFTGHVSVTSSRASPWRRRVAVTRHAWQAGAGVGRPSQRLVLACHTGRACTHVVHVRPGQARLSADSTRAINAHSVIRT
jgi:hypothetical protein